MYRDISETMKTSYLNLLPSAALGQGDGHKLVYGLEKREIKRITGNATVRKQKCLKMNQKL